MNEWEFTGEVKSWIDQILQRNNTLPFLRASVEQKGRGSQKRRDLSLVGRDGQTILTGEIKMPDAADGTTPYRSEVVQDARAKAERSGAKFFFTWNVNECVLWETATAGAGLKDRAYERWIVTSITSRNQLTQSAIQHAIYEWLVKFLHETAGFLQVGARIGAKSPDIKFVHALESALALPIRHTFDSLSKLYGTKPVFKRDLDQWMVSSGWTVVSDPEGVRELLERAAKFGCYLLVNKLVFHEALLKKYGRKLDPLEAPPEVTTGDELRQRLQAFFSEAREVTGDYETIFGEAPLAIENRIPFYSDLAVAGWRGLIEQIHEFDFSKLDYEVVGSIFERLIGPEERQKYGQFYTRVEVVDLINSFCIRDGTAVVMDPACGGGTFLVRAYARKREIAGSRKHKDLLNDIFGVDISQFAAHLTTMNLATRDLVQDENYPCIGRKDFFDVLPDSEFVRLPTKLKTSGLGREAVREVKIPPLDAVVANPPYVRQEEIRRAKKKPKDGGPESGTKEFYLKRVREFGGALLSGRSDLHCYFWPHVTPFLKDGGMLGFITSSQWLDVEYGFKLQAWLLQNYELLAIMESSAEPWFEGARVSTVVTIARKCSATEKRNANSVRFVQLRKPISELVEHDGSTAGAITAADTLRNEILGLTSNVSNHRYRVRLIKQSQLWDEGVKLGRVMRGQQASDEESEDAGSGEFGYYGGKWGIFLRAPDLWFDLLDRLGDRLVPVGQLADVWFGVKSGKDDFFFPKDCSSDCLAMISEPVAFEREYGVARSLVASGQVRLVLAGDKRGEIKAIESRFLEPEVHSLMEVKSLTVSPADCSRLIFLAPSPRSKLKGTYALAYIEWGEANNVHLGSTCAQRQSENREWYDLNGHKRGKMFWPMAQQYKHAIAKNDHNLIANHNLFDLSSSEGKDDALHAVLNSSIMILSKYLFGRPVGNEGNLKTEVVDVRMMLAPDIRAVSQKRLDQLAAAVAPLKARPSLQLLTERRMREMAYQRAGKAAELERLSDAGELDMEDRLHLDHAVLEALGVSSKKERDELIQRLYAYLREFFEETRRKEELAIVNKNVSKRKGAVSPQDVAAQIGQLLNDEEPHWFEGYREVFRAAGMGQNWVAYDTPYDGSAQIKSDLHDVGVVFLKGKKQVGFIQLPSVAHAELAVAVTNEKRQDSLKIPRQEPDAVSLLKTFNDFISRRNRRLRELIGERVADEDVQQKVFDLLLVRIRQGAIAPSSS